MNRQISTYSMIAVAIVAGWFLLLYAPLRNSQEALKQEIETAQATLTDYDRTIRDINTFTETRDQLNQEKQALHSLLYSKHNILNLFSNLEKKIEKQNLQLLEVTPPISELLELNANVADTSKPQFLTLMLKLEGDYIAYGKFVKSLEEASYFRGIERCQLTGSPDRSKQIQYLIKFKALLGGMGTKS